MSQYYLMSQLPSLDGVSELTPLPITEERFYELCNRFLGRKALQTLNRLTLSPTRDEKTAGFPLVDAWNEGEKQLRTALALARAKKLKKTFETDSDTFSVQLTQMVKAAVELEDPMAAEQFLNHFRLDFLESLRPMDAFSEDSVFYYGLRLKLLSRMRQFDEARGRQAYQNIYSSIMAGEEQEARQ